MAWLANFDASLTLFKLAFQQCLSRYPTCHIRNVNKVGQFWTGVPFNEQLRLNMLKELITFYISGLKVSAKRPLNSARVYFFFQLIDF